MDNVLIIEDHLEQRKRLVKCAETTNPQIEVKSTGSVKEAYKIAQLEDIGVFFIDIQLRDGSGIELAQAIRKLKGYQFTPIVFITGVTSYEMEAFRSIHCYDYIIKPYNMKTLQTMMKKMLLDYVSDHKVIQLTEDSAKHILLEFKGIIQKLKLDEIVFVESRNRKIFLVTKNDEIAYKHMSVKKFKTLIDDRFIQVHQSFIVNKNHINKIDIVGKMVFMKYTETFVPIGVSYKKDLGGLIYDYS